METLERTMMEESESASVVNGICICKMNLSENLEVAS